VKKEAEEEDGVRIMWVIRSGQKDILKIPLTSYKILDKSVENGIIG